MTIAALVLVVALAAGFAFLNGFRDVSNAVALSTRTRALTPSIAVLLAAVFNFVGAMLSGTFVLAFTQSWITLPDGTSGLTMLASALAASILWGVYAWWRGIPLSSTNSLVGGLIGAGSASILVGGNSIGGVDGIVVTQVVLPLVLSPLIAFGAAYLLVWPVTWAARYTQPNVVNRRFRRAQAVSSAAVAFGHGLQDGQRTAAVILLAIVAAGFSGGDDVPLWILLLTAVMLTAGTLLGGWRISHTLGHKLIRVDPLRGFVAQTLTSVMLFIGAIGFQLPLSTTHTLTASILGGGVNQRFHTVNRRLVRRILLFWVATPLVTAIAAFILELALSPLTRL
ncbi:inorganic phosphate transporter [Paenarthrobacter nicotinovorans]|uniref:inorganic phosphate transporter n=1 Tax=Paenarthrobacter nicotinovorans TaxID=29320 RepID=UPI00166B1C3B|nr:inorganic phosphate transporter [Paenarthrobacter nicotinovorans]MBP2394382.1 PiT family inorganic phosphate transporter [Paenarthrobacter nicotinovorans]UKE99419.1 inorganic phosphate transporter [Paenarthrobacter nicotinovorans]UKF04201.1 inorganic phosphate transporter [Paenarthrobacter nicotinovorans]GGV38209.1 inorganic phosphate transporter [Paenarthrobacter nicotinovorans]